MSQELLSELRDAVIARDGAQRALDTFIAGYKVDLAERKKTLAQALARVREIEQELTDPGAARPLLARAAGPPPDAEGEEESADERQRGPTSAPAVERYVDRERKSESEKRAERRRKQRERAAELADVKAANGRMQQQTERPDRRERPTEAVADRVDDAAAEALRRVEAGADPSAIAGELSAATDQVAAELVEPRWGTPCEFEVTLKVGSKLEKVQVKHDGGPVGPGKFGHIEFRGAITETGYRSHFGARPGKLKLVEYARRFARHLMRVDRGLAVEFDLGDPSWWNNGINLIGSPIDPKLAALLKRRGLVKLGDIAEAELIGSGEVLGDNYGRRGVSRPKWEEACRLVRAYAVHRLHQSVGPVSSGSLDRGKDAGGPLRCADPNNPRCDCPACQQAVKDGPDKLATRHFSVHRYDATQPQCLGKRVGTQIARSLNEAQELAKKGWPGPLVIGDSFPHGPDCGCGEEPETEERPGMCSLHDWRDTLLWVKVCRKIGAAARDALKRQGIKTMGDLDKAIPADGTILSQFETVIGRAECLGLCHDIDVWAHCTFGWTRPYNGFPLSKIATGDVVIGTMAAAKPKTSAPPSSEEIANLRTWWTPERVRTAVNSLLGPGLYDRDPRACAAKLRVCRGCKKMLKRERTHCDECDGRSFIPLSDVLPPAPIPRTEAEEIEEKYEQMAIESRPPDPPRPKLSDAVKRPGPLNQDAALEAACRGLAAIWTAAGSATHTLSDDQINEALQHWPPAARIPGTATSNAWAVRGGPGPRFWYDTAALDDFDHGQRPTLAGPELVAAVRRVLKIRKPRPSKADGKPVRRREAMA